MRRAVVAAVAVIALGGAAWAYRHRHHADVDPVSVQHVTLIRPVGRPLRVLFVGDSLTVGYYASTRSRAFPTLVTAALRKQGPVSEIVDAKGGVKAAYFAKRPLPKAVLVVIELGSNDFSNDPTPPATFNRDYRRVIANVRASSPSAKLLCVSIWKSSQYDTRGQNILTYNRIIANDCQRGAFVGVSQFFDGSRGPEGRKTWLGAGDDLHPNDVGHARIAAAIAAAITTHSP